MLKTWWGPALPFQQDMFSLSARAPHDSLQLINTNHARMAHHILSRTPAMRTNENTVRKSSNLEHSGKHCLPSLSHSTQDRQSSKWKGRTQKPGCLLPPTPVLVSHQHNAGCLTYGHCHRTGLVLMDLSYKAAQGPKL